MDTLYLFNPENDLALANGDRNYVPPAFARKMAEDLSLLPVWYAKKQAQIYVPIGLEKISQRWMQELGLDFTVYNENQPLSKIAQVEPWGWNPMLHEKLKTWGIAREAYPSVEQIAYYRQLSHRKTGLKVLQKLKEKTLSSAFLTDSAVHLHTIDELLSYASNHAHFVLKEPYSCSGKGLRWIHGAPEKAQLNWAEKVMKQQDGIIAEPIYTTVIDFAFEFEANFSFSSFSCFETLNGIYDGNQLAPNCLLKSKIQSYLKGKQLDALLLELPLILSQELASYNGPLGIDAMMVKTESASICHPCVEINLRRTMGSLAHAFYANYAVPGVVGTFHIQHFKNTPSLQAFDAQKRSELTSVSFRDGQWQGGYFPLVPIHSTSLYLAWVE